MALSVTEIFFVTLMGWKKDVFWHYFNAYAKQAYFDDVVTL